MQKIILFSSLLLLGLFSSQFLPGAVGPGYETFSSVVKLLTMFGLSFIMIHVGYEFELDKSNLKAYGWDYVVAATAAAFPWIFCLLYFVFVLSPPELWGSWASWTDMMLASRFAAPTSAGMLFSMLVAAGLGATWVFQKARILAIFDDLDTVLLMIPLQMMIVGLKWQLGVVIILMAVLLWLAWKHLHKLNIPITWGWVMGYAAAITLVAEGLYLVSKVIDKSVAIHMEVLLPAFVLGCMIAKHKPARASEDPSGDEHHACVLETYREKRVATAVSAAFMVLVGLSLPSIFGVTATPDLVASAHAATEPVVAASGHAGGADAPWPGWSWIFMHVIIITLISNLGKMFPVLCYRKEVCLKERLALSVAMFPRGEVGAGVLIISLSYGIGGPVITVAMFSLALNLLCTGFFIGIVKNLLTPARQEGIGQMEMDLGACAPPEMVGVVSRPTP